MKLEDKGTWASPWIIFSSDMDTGVSICDGKPVWILDGVDMPLPEWLSGIQFKGHINMLTKYAIIATIATGEGVLSSVMKRFSGSG